MAWYREWFGEEYLDLYSHRNSEEAEEHVRFLLERLAPAEPRAVLDLACGAGRHTAALRHLEYRAVGIDLSLTLLSRGRPMPAASGDMRCLPFLHGTFDWVLNFFTSFGYFENEQENFRVLEEIFRVLAPGGSFLIDLFNIDHVLTHLEPRETLERDGRRAEIHRWYDERTRRLNKRIELVGADGTPKAFLESVRAYRRDEVVCGLQWAGLEVTETYGGFDGRSFDFDSPRLILVGRHPG